MPLPDETILDKLYLSRDNLIQQKLDLTLNPKPTYNIDGQQIEWTAYLKYLDNALTDIMKIIQVYEGPYEETTQFLPI